MLVCVCAMHGVYAQNKISGQVTDEINKGVADVSVYLPDLRRGTSTNKEGTFELENLKAGEYLIEVRLDWYSTIVKSIRLERDTILHFRLNHTHQEMSKVLVTGVSRSTELRLNPLIVASTDAEEINQNASTNIIDGLRNIPGISQISTGASISKPVIRGLGYNRVITLNNGIRQEGQQWGDEHGIEIDENAVDRVEIIKGPGSLMYGSDGIAGVINFLAPRSPELGKVNTKVSTNYQSNNRLLAYSVFNAGNKNGFQWAGRISNKRAGNYRNKFDGQVLNSGFKELNGSLSLGLTKSWGHSHISLSSYNNTLNLVEGERDSSGKFTLVDATRQERTATQSDLDGYKLGFPHQKINHLSLSSNSYFIMKNGAIHVDFGFQNNKRQELADASNPDDVELFFDLNTFNYNVRYNLNRSNGWESSIGIGGMQQSNKNRGEEFLIPQYGLFDAGLFVFTQKAISKKLIFAGGARFDNRWVNGSELILDSLGQEVDQATADTEQKFSPLNNTYSGFSGSLGVSYLMSKKSTLKFNVSRGFRAPNMAELSSNGRHEGSFRYEIGEANLKSEISHQIDAGYFLNSDHVSFNVTPFANVISNYIYAEKLIGANGTDSIPDPSNPAPAFKFSSGKTLVWGGELYFDVHPHPLDWLHLANSFSFVESKQQNQSDSTKYLPFTPAPKYRGEIRVHLKTMGKYISNAYVKIAVDHFFEQNRVYSAFGTETPTASYTLISAGLGANVSMFNKKDFLSLFISAENLGDVGYQSHLSRLKYGPENLANRRIGVFNMGRNVSFKAIFTL